MSKKTAQNDAQKQADLSTKIEQKNVFKIDINPESRVTYINKKKGVFWKEWKLLKDCNSEELKQINLVTPHPKYIVLDKDFGEKPVSKDIINGSYQEIKRKLLKHNINNYIADYSRNGFHIFIETKNLDSIDDINVRKELRSIFIKQFNCDQSKKSSYTAISLPGRPHFKSDITHGIIEEVNGPIYNIGEELINIAKERVQKRTQIIQKLEIDTDFKDYFEKDSFWLYLKNNIIPDDTGRNTTIFPNLAIAAIKTGKSDDEIKSIINPVIQKNFPGKVWAEFNGWLKKAKNGKIDTYNFYQINTWMRDFTDKNEDIYDMKLSIQPDLGKEYKEEKNEDINNDKFKFYRDCDLDQLENSKTEWLIEKWIAKGDICFVAGKAASFKSTISSHWAYSIATGGLVFNKYKTIKENVLYLNEENSTSIMISIINRTKKGLELQDKRLDNIYFSMLENIRFDQKDDLIFLAEYMKREKITTLIMDSFRRFIGFDENNATEMNTFFNNLKFLRKMCGLTIIILHHLKKSNGFGGDIRDSLRGSSDIVNSADNIIGIQRKKGSNMIKIEHIKNRNAEEIENKLLIMDSGDKNEMCYIYESDKVLDKLGALSSTDILSEKIYKWIEDNNIKDFAKKDVPEDITTIYSPNVFTVCLREMVKDGIIIKAGGSKNIRYVVNGLVKKEPKKEKKEKIKVEKISQQTL